MTAPTSRLLHLLSLLQMRRAWPGPMLAERLDVSHRTVRRDVERLRGMGYRIGAAMGPEGGYQLEAGADLPPLLFDDDQAIALAIALQTSAHPGSGVEEGALRALTTLRQVLPSRLRHRLDGMAVTVLPGRPAESKAGSVSADVLVELSATSSDPRIVRFDYARPTGGPARHRVEPHGLAVAGDRWYLLAWDLDHDDWRIFRADRLTPRPPHGARFTPREVPGGSVAEFLAARFKGSDQGNRWPCEGTVILHLPARDVLPYIGDGAVEALDEKRCRVRSDSWSWAALAAALMRFDAEIDAAEPPQLREAFAMLATRAARAGS